MELLIILGVAIGAWAFGTGKLKFPGSAPALQGNSAGTGQSPNNPNTPLITPGGHGTGILDTPTGPVVIPTAPPLPQLPALPAGVEQQIPAALGAALGSLPQMDKIPAGFIPGVIDNGDALGPVVVDDIVNVDMFRSGMAIPQNIPVVGLIFMRVTGLKVDGDSSPAKKLRAVFVSTEFMILGEQIINRSSIVEKVTH